MLRKNRKETEGERKWFSRFRELSPTFGNLFLETIFDLIVQNRLIRRRQTGNGSRVFAGADGPVALDVVAELSPSFGDVIVGPLGAVQVGRGHQGNLGSQGDGVAPG